MSNEKAAPIPEDLREMHDSTAEWDGGMMVRFAQSHGIPLPWKGGPDNQVRNYLIDRIATLTAEVAALKSEIARRDAPVTDAEWEWRSDRTWLGSREAFNALILARATPPQDGGKE